jgi:hypothetical protein
MKPRFRVIRRIGMLFSIMWLTSTAAIAVDYSTKTLQPAPTTTEALSPPRTPGMSAKQLGRQPVGAAAICICGGDGKGGWSCDPPGCDGGGGCVCGGDGKGGWKCDPPGCDSGNTQSEFNRRLKAGQQLPDPNILVNPKLINPTQRRIDPGYR